MTSMRLRVWIIDDEALARKRMRQLLSEESGIEIAGESSSGVEALAVLSRQNVDLLFLDIEMPGLNGFEFLDRFERLRSVIPAVVFVTAHPQFSLKAFEAAAHDYLLKPTSRQRLRACLERVRRRLPASNAGSDSEIELRGEASVDAAPRRLAVRRQEKVIYVDVGEIDWVEAAGNYVVIHCGTHSDILRETLGDIEKQLPSDRFVRLSRSALVRITFIREMSGVGTDDHVAVGENGCEWKVTRNVREIDRLLRGGS